jgi:hypothetical protein
MEDLYDTHDYRAKQFYPNTIVNPKDKVGIQFKEFMQLCELEGKSI